MTLKFSITNLKILNKLGEYSGEVHFVLQKSEKASVNDNIETDALDKKTNDLTKKGMQLW